MNENEIIYKTVVMGVPVEVKLSKGVDGHKGFPTINIESCIMGQTHKQVLNRQTVINETEKILQWVKT